jgi:succinoglycan biosynthesis protein ExoL
VSFGLLFAPLTRMTRIAFFGHDAGDAAVRRRVRGFMGDGLEVTGFMMRRQDAAPTEWENVDLGQTHDGRYLQRIGAIFGGAAKAAKARDRLAAADVIYARNLDMLAAAFVAKLLTGLKTPVVYEALDVHRLLTRRDAVGSIFRSVEGSLLKRSALLVVSSPAFVTQHFGRFYKGFRHRLIENRMAAGIDYGPRPQAAMRTEDTPLVIGWIGNLRCSRSLDLLLGVAARFGDKVRIRLHGAPALKEVPNFHERIGGHANVTYAGRYKAPEDLATIYDGLDLVWAGDFMEAGFNSVWLLPNRIYEGGYQGVPAIAPAGTETARWITDHGAGFAVAEDIAITLNDLVAQLLADRTPITEARAHLLSLNEEVFVQPRGELKSMIDEALDGRGNASLNREAKRIAFRHARREEDKPAPMMEVDGATP